MRRHGPVNVIMYFPKTENGKEELGRRVARVHADAVIARINGLTCPESQKQQLLDAVIQTARQQAAAREKGKTNCSKQIER